MDENEGGGAFGDVGDHRNEAISAVADEGFLGEEDDDYEDLYNDVNVGEGFLQSFRKNEDLESRNEEVEKKVEPILPPQTVAESSASIPGVVERKFEKDGDGGSRFSGRIEGFQDVGFRDNEMGVRESVGAPLPRVELGQSSGKVGDLEDQTVNNNNSVPNRVIGQQPRAAGVGIVGNAGNEGFARQGGGHVNGSGGTATGVVAGTRSGGTGSGGGGTILFVGDLHWWTTDAELEAELCKYGPVKEVKFFDEKASGKSKGYCQVEFYDPAAATACKEGMDGQMFNGRPCVVASASPYSIKRMGETQFNRNQQMAQAALAQARRGSGDAAGKIGGNNNATGGNNQVGGDNNRGFGNYQGGNDNNRGFGNYQGGGDNNRGYGNYQGGGDNNRGYGRGNWGRGNGQGMGNRGPTGPMRNRPGGMGGRGIMGNGGNGFGQGIGATPPLLHPQTMMGQGFDPAFGAPMGRMGSYGGFPGAPTPPFSGILSSFPPVGSYEAWTRQNRSRGGVGNGDTPGTRTGHGIWRVPLI